MSRPGDDKLISWRGENGRKNGSGGTDVPLTAPAFDAINVMARHIAAFHAQLNYEQSPNFAPNLIGGIYGYTYVHVSEQDPETFERAKAAAIDVLTAWHGSGEKDLAHVGEKDSRQYFDAVHDFAARMRS